MTKRRETLWRLVKVIYFLITIPILCFLIVLLKDEFKFTKYYNTETTIYSTYEIVNWRKYIIIILILLGGFIILTDFLRRTISYVVNGEFSWFLSYKKILVNSWAFVVVGVGVLIWMYAIWIWYEGIFQLKQGKKNIEETIWGNIKVPLDAIRWDFDWDGGMEYMRSTSYVYREDADWVCYIHFSKNTIPTISIEDCMWWTPVNEGDLNQDWSEEIWFQPIRWQSCWSNYNVYSLKNWFWTDLISPISVHCNQQEQCYMDTWEDCDRISLGNISGEVKVYSSKLTDDYEIIGLKEYKRLN